MTTDVSPFAPADGVKARWRYCYELAATRNPREQVTYQEVMELLDCDLKTAQQAMDMARDRLEADGKRSLVTVPNFGWIVASASDMLRIGEKRERKSARQIRKGVRVLRATPRDELTQFERQAVDRKLASLNALADLHARRARIPLAQIGQPALPMASGE